jgi:hypothetical protein
VDVGGVGVNDLESRIALMSFVMPFAAGGEIVEDGDATRFRGSE